jgi:oxygen-independent coproporphyrinogen-3 oxidase
MADGGRTMVGERLECVMQRSGVPLVPFRTPDPPPAPDVIAAAFASRPGLYLHVPFCASICPFCPYNKVPYREGLVEAYFDHLGRELGMYEAHFAGWPSLYVGGGTPTLCLDGLEALLGRLEVEGERAIEVLPGHVTEPIVGRLLELGFDFVSVGVQSFDGAVLDRLGRPGSPAVNRTAVERAVGSFACVDVDLIFDAAYDDPGILITDATICFDAGVDQVSTYPLMRFGFTPFGKAPHAAAAEHRLLHAVTALAEAMGYERRSVWTFNRIGSPSYTSITRPYYLGIGAGAASFAGSLFTVNHFGLDQYGRALDAGHLPIARVARLPWPANVLYRLFWQAYTGKIPRHGDDPLLEDHLVDVLRLGSQALGLARGDGDDLRLTTFGYDRYHDLERLVTYALIEPLWEEMMAEHDEAAVEGAA